MSQMKRFGAWPIGPWYAEDPPFYVTDRFQVDTLYGNPADLVYRGEWAIVRADGKVDPGCEPLNVLQVSRYVIAPIGAGD